MGSLYSKLNEPLEACAGSVTQIITGRKRKRSDSDSGDEGNSVIEKSMNTPKKKKLQTTTQYIYQALFKEQRDSDVSVMALGKIWHLHKVYLGQSPYFASMFSGSWRETDQDFVKIEIIDPKINHEALETVFGSLYMDEVTIDPKTVVSVLATATLFQLDGLIEQCAAVMTETVNYETTTAYYEAACEYGVQSVKSSTFSWLLMNLLRISNKHTHSNWLREISIELMEALVKSPDLFVLQTEFSLYILLRLWLYCKLNPNYEINEQKSDHLTYFSSRVDKKPFLLTKTGEKYVRPFKELRIQHILNHPTDLHIILEDNVIPQSWLNSPLLTQWNFLLRIDQALDQGPKETDSEIFLETCLRCGRILKESGYQKWRWTGFNFGLDLILITDTKTLSIKRHHRTEHERLLSLQAKRQFMIRVTVASLNEQRQIKHSQITNIKFLSLDKNEEVPLIHLDKELDYPLLISVNLLVVSPTKKSIQQPSEGTTQMQISNLGSTATNSPLSVDANCSGSGSTNGSISNCYNSSNASNSA